MTSRHHEVDRFREQLSPQIETVRRELSARIDAPDQRMSRRFLLGVQVTVLPAVIGTLPAVSVR